MGLIKTFCMAMTAIFGLAFCACNQIPQTDYSSFIDIPAEGMPENWEFDFTPTAEDSAAVMSRPQNAVLIIRYTGACPSREILLNLEEVSLAGEIPDSTSLRIPLFTENGTPLGNGVYGVYEIADTIHRGIKVPDGYVLSVSSPLSQGDTRGIKSIGLILSPEVERSLIKRMFPSKR